jgi:hypothetical protein
MTMSKYIVTIQAAVNIRVAAVEADTQQDAISAAMGKVDLYDLLARHQPTPKVAFTEYAEEVREALVDEVGDEEFERSGWFLWHKGEWVPTPANRQEELRLLDEQAESIRKELGYSQPGQVIWMARLDFDESLAVVADGYGRASVLRVSGNYPVEYVLKDRHDFDSEQAACAEAVRQAAAWS